MNKLIKGFALSSIDPQNVSASLRGLMIANIGIIMWLIQYFDLPLSIEEVTNLIGIVSAIVGTTVMLFGLARKLYVFIKSKLAK